MQSGRNAFLVVGIEARVGDWLDLPANAWKFFQHEIEIRGWDFYDIDRIERGAGSGAFDRTEQTDLPKIIAAAQISSHHFAAGQMVRHAHHARADEVKRVRVFAFLADNLALVVGNEFDVLSEVLHEFFIERCKERNSAEMSAERTFAIFFFHLGLERRAFERRHLYLA